MNTPDPASLKFGTDAGRISARDLVKCLYPVLTAFHCIGHLTMIEFLVASVVLATEVIGGWMAWRVPDHSLRGAHL